MRLVALDTPYGTQVAAMEPDGYLDLQAAERLRQRDEGLSQHLGQKASERVPADMMAFLAAGRPAMEAARQALAFGRKLDRNQVPWYPLSTPIGPPVRTPGKIFVMRGNFRGHVMEVAQRINIDTTPPDRPRYFAKASSCVIGPGQSVVLSPLTTSVQHEVELGVVIGTTARKVPIERVDDYIAGYTIFLDMSARNLSQKDDRWKSFDTFGPMGPCLVPPEDIGDPHNLSIKLSVNGQLRQNGNTRDLEFRIPEIISFMSQAFTLQPGDVISTGTPEGAQPIEPGDVMEAEIENIGVLRIGVMVEE